jgi:hypothetical protein
MLGVFCLSVRHPGCQEVHDGTLAAVAASCPALRSLSVANTGVSDDGVAHLAALSALRHLDLSGAVAGGQTDATHGWAAAAGGGILRALSATETATCRGSWHRASGRVSWVPREQATDAP